MKQTCSCPCGTSRVEVNGALIGRLYCHCTICQRVYRRPYADVVYLWARGVSAPDTSAVEFRKFRPPPALNRGHCRQCGNPVVAYMPLGPLSVAFIPARNFERTSDLPCPARHIFYDRRVADVADDVSKTTGYWPSEAYVVGTVLADFIRPNRSA